MSLKTSNKKLGVAIVGLGYWGPNLVRNFSSHPQISVELICDKDPSRLARFALMAKATTTSYQDVLENPSIDAVVIATPVNTHYPLAKLAIEAKKHVWIEKPLTDDAQTAQDLCHLAEEHKVKIFVDHTFIYQPAIRKAKEVISSGELGDVFYFDSTRINLGLLQQDVNVIWDLAPHDLSILNYFIGETPHSVTAVGASHNTHRLEDMAYVTFLYHEGLIAHLNFNWLSPLKVRRILVGGSKKMLVYDDLETSEKIKIYDKGITVYGGRMDQDGMHQMLINYRMGDMRSPNLDNTEALSIGVHHFVQYLSGQERPLSSGLEGLKVVQMIEAIQNSLQNSGKAVRLPTFN